MAFYAGSTFPVWVREEVTPVTTQVITLSGLFNHLFLTNAGTIAAVTINLPTNPVDGQKVKVSNIGALTAVTWSPTVSGSSAGLAVGQGALVEYSATLPGWFIF